MRLFFTLFVALLFTVATPVRAIGVMPPPAVDTETTVEAAKAEHQAMLDAMTPAERRAYKKEKRRELKSLLKQLKLDRKNDRASDLDQTTLIILCIIPPLAVYLHQGGINDKFWISLLLTILLWLPGFIYAVLLVTGNISKRK